jgi:hypothetical protein
MFLTPDSVKRMTLPEELNTDGQGAQLAGIALEREALDIRPNYARHCLQCDYQDLCRAALTDADVSGLVVAKYRRQAGGLTDPAGPDKLDSESESGGE